MVEVHNSDRAQQSAARRDRSAVLGIEKEFAVSPWEPPPDVGVEARQSLTLILSTQRSGIDPARSRPGEPRGGSAVRVSTSPEANTGEEGRGRVRNGRARGSPAWYRQGSTPGVTGINLQVSQAAAVAQALTGHPLETSQEAMSTVVSWAQDRFDRVLVVVLVRNAIDIAISRVFAMETARTTRQGPGRFRQARPFRQFPTSTTGSSAGSRERSWTSRS